MLSDEVVLRPCSSYMWELQYSVTSGEHGSCDEPKPDKGIVQNTVKIMVNLTVFIKIIVTLRFII